MPNSVISTLSLAGSARRGDDVYRARAILSAMQSSVALRCSATPHVLYTALPYAVFLPSLPSLYV